MLLAVALAHLDDPDNAKAAYDQVSPWTLDRLVVSHPCTSSP